MSINDEIRERLYEAQDMAYKKFQGSLIPTMAPERMIGVRTPTLKKMAKELSRREDVEAFLSQLPHAYFEENQLHAFIISGGKDYVKCLGRVEAFLPYVDNWATCDQMSPAVFKKHRQELLQPIKAWLESSHIYTRRFGIGMLMQHFWGEDFRLEYADWVANLRSEEYYVNMMIAWYFATALAKQYGQILPYIQEHRLDRWTHNKAIQKAMESCRISPEQKACLKTLKRK